MGKKEAEPVVLVELKRHLAYLMNRKKILRSNLHFPETTDRLISLRLEKIAQAAKYQEQLREEIKELERSRDNPAWVQQQCAWCNREIVKAKKKIKAVQLAAKIREYEKMQRELRRNR